MDRDLLDWRRIGRRLIRVLIGAVAVAILGMAVTWGMTGEVSRGGVLLWLGVGALLLVVGAMLVVTVSALRGMLRAGDRGDWLAGGDVGLLPPQVRSGPQEPNDRADVP